MMDSEPISLSVGAGEGNRTLVFSLEGCCSAIELHPRRCLPSREGPRENASARSSQSRAAKSMRRGGAAPFHSTV